MSDFDDAFGHGLYDYLKGKGQFIIIERDDGLIEAGKTAGYFAEYIDWPEHEKKAFKYAKGRVLDIGCGAGRHSIYLQDRGLDVLGVDISSLAIKVCELRGLKKAKVLPITQIGKDLGKFDTILMLGNNFGLFANKRRTKWLLKRFYNITTKNALIIAETRDPYKTDEPIHLKYHESNRKRGRMAGQVKLRIRYKIYADSWFDYLMVSQEELKAMLKDTRWSIKKFIESDTAMYISVIQKEGF